MASEKRSGGKRPVEVTVERLPEDYDPELDSGPAEARDSHSQRLSELSDTIGPVIAGLLVDLLDAATINPAMGLFLGWPLGYYIVRKVGCQPSTAWKLGALIGVYCAVPGTFLIPMATLVVVFAKVRQFLRAS